jgi:hypothetical protein
MQQNRSMSIPTDFGSEIRKSFIMMPEILEELEEESKSRRNTASSKSVSEPRRTKISEVSEDM